MHSIPVFRCWFLCCLGLQGHLIGEKYQTYQHAGIKEKPRFWILSTMYDYAYNKTLLKLITVI
jgi:hypothetical protein